MYISDYLHLFSGRHQDLPFFNINLEHDTKMFLDPANIFVGEDKWSLRAQTILDDYFLHLKEAFEKDDENCLRYLFSHGHEPNYTMLGYGEYRNGKGNTAHGLLYSFNELRRLYARGIKLTNINDMKLCFPGFANDGLSDLITNLLTKVLTDFTHEVCDEFGVPYYFYGFPSERLWHWDCDHFKKGGWRPLYDSMLLVRGMPILLVPKQWVRSTLFGGPAFFVWHIILDEIQNSLSTKRLKVSKKVIRAGLKQGDKELARGKLLRDPDCLKLYHQLLWKRSDDMVLSDCELDFYAGIGNNIG